MLDLVAEVSVEEELKQESLKRFKVRRDAYIKRVMTLVAPVVKSWYLKTSVLFLKEKNLREEEEELFADFTEYCTDRLDELCKERNQSVRNSYPL